MRIISTNTKDEIRLNCNLQNIQCRMHFLFILFRKMYEFSIEQSNNISVIKGYLKVHMEHLLIILATIIYVVT